jgi:TRAP-type mannitol/chloroaromatic compound transport system permease small subunit
MRAWLAAARRVDAFNAAVGRWVRWLILAAIIVSAGNAIVRKIFSTSSNALLEVQWYLFATVFMLCAGYVMLKDGHVRIDFVSARLSGRARSLVEVAGLVLIAIPFCVLLIQLSLPLAIEAFRSGEVSPNAGGLVRWPVYSLLPLGMLLLLAQSLSQLVKQIALLRGIELPESMVVGSENRATTASRPTGD